MIGIPLGAILSSKVSLKAPIYTAVGLCALNVLLISLFLPESLPPKAGSDKATRKPINWKEASPMEAARMLTRTRSLAVGSLAYLLVNIAQAGIQINWINYLQHRFNWHAAKSGSTLILVGLLVAVMPKLFINTLAVKRGICTALVVHALSIVILGFATHTIAIYGTMMVLAAGAASQPMILG